MTTYRPTTLRLALQHCPRAVDYYEERRPQFRDHFAVGIAAHAVLDQLGHLAQGSVGLDVTDVRTIADATARRLMEVGRSFDGQQEPPLPADAVFEGRDLAVAWALRNPLSPTARYELGAGFSRDWEPVPYGATDARFRLIFDVLDLIEESDEEGSCLTIVCRDYKSAWPTDASELDTIQMRAQAVCAMLLHPEADFVAQEVVNLRTGQSYRRSLWRLDAMDTATLASWQRDLTMAMDALDTMAPHVAAFGSRTFRPARPGIGCMGCPWILSCPEARDFLDQINVVHDPESIARGYAVAQAERDALLVLAREVCAERTVKVDGGEVGYLAKEGQEAAPDAATRAWTAWQERGGDLPGYLTALRPGVTALEGVARVMAPRKKDAQQELLGQWTVAKTKKEFGVKKTEGK